eukprot:TRINITY_DN7976_c0_g4_i1.p3 TRINITY_DN7976_c0_g4~~TRINITY_DN7976_c0_g4_i1.p3  ORF type:complete len:139 (-),score=41.98 TRINITY_DN7976_c0_g4_i1:1369-1785(-)
MYVSKAKAKHSKLVFNNCTNKNTAATPSTPLAKKLHMLQTVQAKGNLEVWFQSLLRCREKRKAEMHITANFIYIIYSLITFSIGKEKSVVDISDGLILCEIINVIQPNTIRPQSPCTSTADKLCNLKRYSEVCLYSSL